jgi:hypothetical protein
VPTYCGQSCKQQAYERRRHRGAMLLLVEDNATMKVRELIRSEVRDFLVQIGLIDSTVLPPTRPSARKPDLRLVKNDKPED